MHLVVYSTTARVAFENGKLAESERLLTIVDALKTEGNTNISGGLQCAFQLLAGKTSPRRVFLFSDGEANEGVSAAIEMEQVVSFLHSHGVNVTSFGIGDSYEEKMMRAIAKAGHGGISLHICGDSNF